MIKILESRLSWCGSKTRSLSIVAVNWVVPDNYIIDRVCRSDYECMTDHIKIQKLHICNYVLSMKFSW